MALAVAMHVESKHPLPRGRIQDALNSRDTPGRIEWLQLHKVSQRTDSHWCDGDEIPDRETRADRAPLMRLTKIVNCPVSPAFHAKQPLLTIASRTKMNKPNSFSNYAENGEK